jgi:hypothetical protein
VLPSALVEEASKSVPLFPNPLKSLAVVPLPSSNGKYKTNPD